MHKSKLCRTVSSGYLSNWRRHGARYISVYMTADDNSDILDTHPSIILYGVPGCIEAETFISYQVRTPEGKKQNDKGGTIAHLYRRFNGLPSQGKGAYQRASTVGSKFFALSIDAAGLILRNEIEAVVASGAKECFELVTATGRICTTLDHKFWNGERYVALRDLRIGDTIFVHNNTRCEQTEDEDTTKTKRHILYVKHHATASQKIVREPTTGKDYVFFRLPRARAVIEAAMNKMDLSAYVAALNEGRTQGLEFLPSNVDVHHKDEDRSNDAIENLEVLEHTEHARIHSAERGNLRYVAVPTEILNISSVGVRETYDISMKAPNHNFVANGFVVHNSGKTTQCAKAFQNCLWVVSKKEVLRPYASWLRDNAEEAKKLGLAMIPKDRIIEMRPMELAPDGKMRKLDTEVRIRKLLNDLSVTFAKKPDLPISGVIFDEWSAFAASILEDIQRRVGKSWGAYDELVNFHRELCEWPGLNKKVLGLVCHSVGPKYFEEGPKAGQLQYRGGPAIPGGKTVGLVCAAASVVLQLDVSTDEFMPSAPAKRVYRTEVHPLWERKFRDFSAKPEEELGLRELLLRAGFRL